MRRLDTTEPAFEAGFAALLGRGSPGADPALTAQVAAILAAIRRDGDVALGELTARYDGQRHDGQRLTPAQLRVTPADIDAACAEVPEALHAALDLAATRIEAFHRVQLPADLEQRDAAGVALGLRWTPLDAAGLYVPGGKAAYPSSVLMNALPARVAGVGRLCICVPAPGGVLNPLVLAAARRAGIDEIYRIGGAQAIAAMAYGTATIAPVDRIVGPGNAYVAEAKRQVFGHVGIDSIAGPSEVVVVADRSSDPGHVALDLLAQAEHDEMAQAILITDTPALAAAVTEAIADLLRRLPRAAIADASWKAHGATVVVRDWDEAAHLVNRIAPEHLQLMLDDPAPLFAKIRHAGAIFLGRYCPEALGDYVAGPNHVLPTNGTARFSSGLSVYDFLKRTSWVSAGRDALARIGPAAIALAEAEGLQAHAESIAVRLGRNHRAT